jgi:hypothetical protein
MGWRAWFETAWRESVLVGKRGLNCGEYGVYGGFNKKVVKKASHKLKIL